MVTAVAMVVSMTRRGGFVSKSYIPRRDGTVDVFAMLPLDSLVAGCDDFGPDDCGRGGSHSGFFGDVVPPLGYPLSLLGQRHRRSTDEGAGASIHGIRGIDTLCGLRPCGGSGSPNVLLAGSLTAARNLAFKPVSPLSGKSLFSVGGFAVSAGKLLGDVLLTDDGPLSPSPRRSSKALFKHLILLFLATAERAAILANGASLDETVAGRRLMVVAAVVLAVAVARVAEACLLLDSLPEMTNFLL